MVGWKIEVEIQNEAGQPLGEAEAEFSVYGPFLSFGVHCLFLKPHLTFVGANWDGHAPGEKTPIIYSYVDDADTPVPTGQIKLYWLLRSSATNPAPTLSLQFRAEERDLSTPILACLSDVVANGSNAIHDDPTLVIESQLMFPYIHTAKDLERVVQRRRMA